MRCNITGVTGEMASLSMLSVAHVHFPFFARMSSNENLAERNVPGSAVCVMKKCKDVVTDSNFKNSVQS